MKVRELIKELLDKPMDATVYVGKGCGPLGAVDSDVPQDRIVVILKPERAS